MRIDPKGTIAHHPALMVRDCLRKLKVYMAWDLRVLEKAASVEPGRGRALAKVLSAGGLIEKVRRDTWTITQRPEAFVRRVVLFGSMLRPEVGLFYGRDPGGAGGSQGSPALSFKRAQLLDLLLKILPPELLPHEEEGYSPYREDQEEGKSI